MITKPLYTHGPNHWFGQYPMSQNQLAVSMLSMALDYENPDVVIEIGTQQGGLVCALAELNTRGTQFYSLDITDQRPEEVKKGFAKNHIHFVLEDCFEFIPKILAMRRHGKYVILCDGGNKNLEFSTFRPLLASGDVIMAHDWIYGLKTRNQNDLSMFWDREEFTNNLKDDYKDPLADEFSYPWYSKQLAHAAWFVQKRN